MKRQYIVFILSIFLLGCSSQTSQNEKIVPTAAESVDDDERITASDFSSYSGNWAFWNNPDVESSGGIDLWLSVSDQFVEAELSSWSENFNRLADTYLSGIIQDNKVTLHFDDDGRGQAGNITLLFEDGAIEMESYTDEESKSGDFTFPKGPIVLKRVESNDEAPVYYSDGAIQDMQAGNIESNYITDRTTGINHYFIDSENNLWGTGHNDYWQLGIENENDRGSLDTFYADPVKIAENVIHVDASENGYFTIYVTENHELFGLGANTDGILRQPVQEFEDLNLHQNIMAKPVKLMDHVLFASAGRQSISVLDGEGNVWWWGRFSSTTAAKVGTENDMYSEEPRCMVKNARYTVCGGDFAAAIDENDNLWTWGNNVWGQCGTAPVWDYIEDAVNVSEDVQMVWVELLSSKQNIISAEELDDYNPYRDITYSYTMFVKKNDGMVYACGINIGMAKRPVQIFGNMENENGDVYVHSYSSELVPIKIAEW